MGALVGGMWAAGKLEEFTDWALGLTRAEVGIGPATARIMQRIAGADETPEPQTDEALAALDRVVLSIAVERVGPVNYLTGQTA